MLRRRLRRVAVCGVCRGTMREGMRRALVHLRGFSVRSRQAVRLWVRAKRCEGRGRRSMVQERLRGHCGEGQVGERGHWTSPSPGKLGRESKATRRREPTATPALVPWRACGAFWTSGHTASGSLSTIPTLSIGSCLPRTTASCCPPWHCAASSVHPRRVRPAHSPWPAQDGASCFVTQHRRRPRLGCAC